MVLEQLNFITKHRTTYGIMLSYTTYIHTIKPPVVTRHDPRTNASSASNQTSAPPYHSTPMASKEIRKDKVYSQRAEQCRFIGYADDVDWTNSPQISSYDSYIVLMKDGIKRLIRYDVIFELYQDQPTILKVDPADRDPSELFLRAILELFLRAILELFLRAIP